MRIQPRPIRAHDHHRTAGTHPSVRQAHNALEEAWDTFRQRPRGPIRGAIYRRLTTAQTWLREGNLSSDGPRPKDSRGEPFRTTLALIGGGYRALELLIDQDRNEIVRKFNADGAFFCSTLRRGDAASSDLAEFLLHASPGSLHSIPGHHEETDFLTLVVPTLMASALAGGPRGLADAVEFFTHAARNNHAPQHAAPSEIRAAASEPARTFERPAAPPQKAKSPQRQPLLTIDRSSEASPVRTAAAMPRPDPASASLNASRAPLPSAHPAQIDFAAVQNALRVLQPLLAQAPGVPQQRSPQSRERAASVQPGRSSAATQAPRLPGPTPKGSAPSAPSKPSAPRPVSHQALGKRSATEAPHSPPSSTRPRLVEPRAPRQAAAGEATFEWKRNNRAITSTPALFNALNLSSATGTGGAVFSARLGSLWVQDAPLVFFADATSAKLVPVAQDAAVTFTFNGYSVACSRQNAGLLVASRLPSGPRALAVTVNDQSLVSDTTILRQLLSNAALSEAAVFDGTFNGRPLKAAAPVVQRLLGPPAIEMAGNRSWENVQLEGDSLHLPTYLLRQLLLAPRQAASGRGAGA